MRQRTLAWLTVLSIGMSFGLATAALAADPTGTWTWTREINGNTVTTTLKLKQEGKNLTGTISGRDNTESPIEDAKVDGDMISFKVTREFNGNKMVFNYSGKVTGDEIVGETKFERNGEAQTREWKAKKGG